MRSHFFLCSTSLCVAAVSLRGSDVRWRWEGHWGLGAAVLWFVFLTCVLLFYFVLVFLSGCDFSCLTFFHVLFLLLCFSTRLTSLLPCPCRSCAMTINIVAMRCFGEWGAWVCVCLRCRCMCRCFHLRHCLYTSVYVKFVKL